MDKTPYVPLERIKVDSQPVFEHGLQRIPIAKRRPIVLVEKLPVAVTHGLQQSGESPSGQSGRKVLKRKVSPGPSRRPCPDTPSKRACFSNQGSRKYPHMRLWTGPKSNGRQKSAKENGTSQYYSCKSLWEDQAESSVQSAISSVKSANLSVLLGVRSRGIPIVELERLQNVTVYKHCDMPSQDTVTADCQPRGNEEPSSEDSEPESDLPKFSKPSRRKKTSKSPRKIAAVGYQETESSDDNCMARCKYCGQHLDKVSVAAFSRCSVTEEQLLRRPEFLSGTGEKPACKVSNVQVYDQSEHLVALDLPKRLDSVNLFLSAQISPVWEEERKGIECKGIGPIRCWWLTGYGSGEKPVIGISTDSADYYISNEHKVYADFVKPLRRKMYLTKLVVDAVNEDPDCSYENLVKVIQDASVPELGDEKCFSEEELLKHGEFVAKHACSYDEARDSEYEPTALRAPCLQRLIDLCRIRILSVGKDTPLRRFSRPTDTLATCTPLVQDVFREAFTSQMSDVGESSFDGTRRQGRRICPSCRGWLQTGTSAWKKALAWCGSPEDTGTVLVYSAVMIGDEKVTYGSFVTASRHGHCCPRVGCIMRLFESQARKKMAHIQWFMCSCETILGEVADPSEIYFVCECEDIAVSDIISACNVKRKFFYREWYEEGGKPYTSSMSASCPKDGFTYSKMYFPALGRFEDVPEMIRSEDTWEYDCYSCIKKEKRKKAESCRFGEVLFGEKNGKVYYSSVKWQKETYSVGNCIFLKPGVLDRHPSNTKASSKFMDLSNVKRCEPFQVACILSISATKTGNGQNVATFRIRKFCRPEDTHLDKDTCRKEGLNVLYYTKQEADVYLHDVCGKVQVVFSKYQQHDCPGIWSVGDVFVFSKMYDSSTRKFFDVPPQDQLLGREKISETMPRPRLRTLEAFSGCGGFSCGLKAVGAIKSCWAVENSEVASRAFQRNFPESTVFTQDFNSFLNDVLEGKMTNSNGQQLPQKGDVQLLCGGPPCQGFSGLNRFRHTERSLLKNSLVSSYLSCCDYYRPQLFLLENVKGFLNGHDGRMLPLTLKCLLRMGYQCTFGLLQAGNYGLPQSRRRVIILAAAPGQVLPRFPEPKSSFKSREQSSIIQKQEFHPATKWSRHAPLRTITLYDAISDLASLELGTPMTGTCKPVTHYQQMVRGSNEGPVRDLELLTLSPLMQARVDHIPLFPGANWRDLPNIRVRLSDGTYTKILTVKTYEKGIQGVCPCAAGGKCDPLPAAQKHTLVPWTLVHRAGKRVAQGSLDKAYARLGWDGCMGTVTTLPSPCKFAVLHPSQNRLLTVREHARVQGFPDDFVFVGSVCDKYMQVGNAVPPPLAAAIGQEIIKSLSSL
ncbi:DNA (cytosine-5)-methyltransferase PliMCI-like isoform X1 [Dermacentor albipictus]|uniref:DNA (cytosine-5)-methyltransferase PliMCI-like isoform X1 n=1 Tax=Dermacentor albipictus TaxID=60249 RepID=UPI0038FCA8F3